jgi:hypothetical protein
MKRIVLISSLAIMWSVAFAAPVHAQYPTGGYYWQGQYYVPGSNSNYWLNNWQSQYPAYGINQYQHALPNVVTQNTWNSNSVVPTLYAPTNVGGYRVKLVPYPSPNIYAAPRYMYVPAR